MLPLNLWTSICTYVSLNCTKNLCLSLMKRSMCNLSFHQKSCLIIPPTKILYRSHSTLGFLVPLDQHPYGVSQHLNFFFMLVCTYIPTSSPCLPTPPTSFFRVLEQTIHLKQYELLQISCIHPSQSIQFNRIHPSIATKPY